ncbi:hypothetical protein BH23ACT6_BH23ACT6_20120 [soil metagenome]
MTGMSGFFRVQLVDHRRREFNARHRDSPRCERDRNPAGADRELDGTAFPGQLSQHVHRGSYCQDLWIGVSRDLLITS